MHKRAAVINDLSSLGRCSLAADLAVLPAMGIEACPLPTAVLTAQTGYPKYRMENFADKMSHYTTHWQELEVSFSGILSGYFTCPEEIIATEQFLDVFQQQGVPYLCDPVLGDNGHVYRGFTEETIKGLQRLATRASVLTPNLTEFCFLTETPLAAVKEKLAHPKEAFAYLQQQAKKFSQQRIVITGIHYKENQQDKITNLVLEDTTATPVVSDYLGGSYSGTGDLFAAVLLGGLLQGRTLVETVRLAGTFIACAIKDAQKENTPYNDGVNYESYLEMLRKT